MTSIDVLCKICSKHLSTKDQIVSTNCGHVFHNQCLIKSKNETPQCPQCLAEIKTNVRLLLLFETGPSNKDNQIKELRAQITHFYSTQGQIQQELNAVKKQFETSQAECKTKDERIKQLNKKIEHLKIENSQLVKKTEDKDIKIRTLEKSLNSSNTISSAAFQEEIRVLQERNKQMSLEIAKEIRNSSQLTVEKIKLEHMLEHAISNQQQGNSSMRNKINDLREPSITKEFTNSETIEKILQTSDKDEKQNEDFVQSVVIKNVRELLDDNEESLKKYVFKLSNLMELYFTGDDILKVSILNRQNQKTKSLIAKFKTLSMKSMFLSRKDKLKLHPETKNLFLYEYVSDDTHILFQNAKCLHFLGFKHVYCRNNVVLVKKNKNSNAVEIKSKADIEKLMEEAKSSAAVNS